MESRAKIFFRVAHEISDGNVSVVAAITDSLSISCNISKLDSHGRSSIQNSGISFLN
jgi:hypothetical protein